MARHGLVRSGSQTHREFAVLAGIRLAEATGRLQLAGVPTQVADAFYRARFGRLPLDIAQTKAVEHALKQLDQLDDPA